MNTFCNIEDKFPKGSDLDKAYKLWVANNKPKLREIIESGVKPYSDFLKIAETNNAENCEEYVFDLTFELLYTLGLVNDDGIDIL